MQAASVSVYARKGVCSRRSHCVRTLWIELCRASGATRNSASRACHSARLECSATRPRYWGSPSLRSSKFATTSHSSSVRGRRWACSTRARASAGENGPIWIPQISSGSSQFRATASQISWPNCVVSNTTALGSTPSNNPFKSGSVTTSSSTNSILPVSAPCWRQHCVQELWPSRLKCRSVPHAAAISSTEPAPLAQAMPPGKAAWISGARTTCPARVVLPIPAPP